MNRQADIDKICEWMGWHIRPHHSYSEGTPWREWANADNHYKAESTFNPFTNPSDCAVVMDEVREKALISIEIGGTLVGVRLWTGKGYQATAYSWMEAFCNALLGLIKGE